MKKALLLTFFVFSAALYAQQEPPLYLEYDNAGNQILSDLVCVNCPEEAGSTHSLDKVIYYPNPVAQELNLAWENTDEFRITTVYIYALNGKLIASRNNLDSQTELNLNFSNKAPGIYIIEFLSNNNQKKSFKIIKK